MNKAVSIILALVMLFSIAVMPVYAQTEPCESETASVQPRYTYIESAGATLTISDGKATAEGTLKCYSDNTTSCSVTVFLQRRAIGTTTWYNYTFNTGSGTTNCTASVSLTVVSGYEYRAKAEFSVNNGAETATRYSEKVQYNPST